jgi:hypothetical protein
VRLGFVVAERGPLHACWAATKQFLTAGQKKLHKATMGFVGRSLVSFQTEMMSLVTLTILILVGCALVLRPRSEMVGVIGRPITFVHFPGINNK